MKKPGKVRIGNIKNFRSVLNTQYVRVDRSSNLGNPFILKNETERNLVCDQYEKHFYETLLNNESIRKYLNSLVNILLKGTNIELLCWCEPKRCHAQTIKNYLDNQIQTYLLLHENE